MTTCTDPVCRRRTAALSRLVDLLQPDRDQQRALADIDGGALASAEASLVDLPAEPDTIRCRACGAVKPLEEYSNTGQGRRKTCRDCHADSIRKGMARASARKARRIDAPTGQPVVTHGPKFPSNGGR